VFGPLVVLPVLGVLGVFVPDVVAVVLFVVRFLVVRFLVVYLLVVPVTGVPVPDPGEVDSLRCYLLSGD
jgi:hypothetical protein